MACDKVIVPIQVEFFAVEGLKVLIRMLDELGELGYQPKRRYLLTMCDNRRKITEEVSSKIRDLLGDAVFDVVIPENVRLVSGSRPADMSLRPLMLRCTGLQEACR
ncbi:MAG: ParA family protein [Methanotrichaceae archaeon]